MKKMFLTAIVLVSVSGSAWAETINATVNGMVCAFCVTGIEKSFKKNEAVEDVKVDLDGKIVTIHTKSDKTLNDAAVKKVINDAGYDLTKIERSKQ